MNCSPSAVTNSGPGPVSRWAHQSAPPASRATTTRPPIMVRIRPDMHVSFVAVTRLSVVEHRPRRGPPEGRLLYRSGRAREPSGPRALNHVGQHAQDGVHVGLRVLPDVVQ